MYKPLVTIVTPTFNQAKYIEQTIISVLNQDYSNLEYIIIDDGSTDGTDKILERYKSSINIVTQSNKGQSASLNKGWELAKGEIISYISSDDSLDSRAVSKSVAAFSANRGIVAVYCDFHIINDSGKQIGTVSNGDFSKKKLVEELICQPGAGAFFLKEQYILCGKWDPTLHQLPDFDFWLKLSNSGDFLRIPEALASYRVHNESASYRPINIERSNEIIEVVKKYWDSNPCNNLNKSRSIAKSFLFAASNHFRSGRYSDGLRLLICSFHTCPALFLEAYTLKTVLANIRKHWMNRRA